MITLDSKQRIAKKRHKCNFCNGIIEIGEKYDWSKNVFDGVIYEWKNHISCGQIASKLNMYDWCDDGVTEEDFRESIQEEYHNIMSTEYREMYESSDFRIPPFCIQLDFVKRKHL